MKIAVACEGQNVSQHFGHCESFRIYNVDKEGMTKENFPNPGHASGSLPDFLQQKGVTVVITGGAGQGAKNLLNQKGIQPITGAAGPADAAVAAYLNGALLSKDVACDHSNHASCNGAGCGGAGCK